MQSKTLIIFVALFLVGGVSGFFGGTQYQKSKSPLSGAFGNLTGEQRAQRFGAMAGSIASDSGQRRGLAEGQTAVSGEVISKDATSLTIKLPDNSSKIILLTNDVPVRQTTESNIESVEVGESVIVQGQQNQDGSVTAQSIQSGISNFAFQASTTPTQ
ncbi:MAG: hypothetical protein Q8N55_02075 [bacterium]|nr:hypothetical protein [bacterium]